MTRQDALDAQRKRGLPTLAVLPIHYPREVLESLDVLGIELWGPPGPLAGGSSARIQPYVCSLVRNALAFIDGGGIDGVDGLLIPNTCDSMMGFASLVGDLSTWDGPLFNLHLPRLLDEERSVAFLEGEIERLWHAIGDAFDRPMDEDRLEAAIATRREIEAAQREIRRVRRELPQSERELMELLRGDSWMPAEEHLTQLKDALSRRGEGPERDGPGVVISGIVPEPMALLDALEETGAVVVAEDYAAVGRRITQLDEAVRGDPVRLAARRLAARPPCSPLNCEQKRRADQLVRLVRGSGAKGLLVHNVRFCEPELFDVPALKERMEEEGFPALFLDTEVERELDGPVRTRIEAFVEMLP